MVTAARLSVRCSVACPCAFCVPVVSVLLGRVRRMSVHQDVFAGGDVGAVRAGVALDLVDEVVLVVGDDGLSASFTDGADGTAGASSSGAVESVRAAVGDLGDQVGEDERPHLTEADPTLPQRRRQWDVADGAQYAADPPVLSALVNRQIILLPRTRGSRARPRLATSAPRPGYAPQRCRWRPRAGLRLSLHLSSRPERAQPAGRLFNRRVRSPVTRQSCAVGRSG